MALVTIGIPTYQRPDYLLLAVKSALAQSHTDIQVIVSDNASTVKASIALAKVLDARLVIHEHATTIPIFDNWDACVERAAGEYFLLLSDDDILYPDAVKALLAGFSGSPEFSPEQIGVSYGHCCIIDSAGTTLGSGRIAPKFERAPKTVLEFFYSSRSTQPCNLMMRTADIRTHGGYAGLPELGIVRDAKVWAVIALQRGAVHFTDHLVADYRTHAVSGTFQADVGQALRNNMALAALRADVLVKSGEGDIARKIKVAAKRLNGRVFIALTRPQARYRKNPFAPFGNFCVTSTAFYPCGQCRRRSMQRAGSCRPGASFRQCGSKRT